MKNTKKIPTLRFPEFSGEWEVKKMQDVTKINQGLQIEISERFTHQVENSYFYITNEFLKNGSKKKFFIKNPPASVLCNKDDILMTRTGNTGMVVTNVEGAFHNNFFKIKYDIGRINKNFYYYFLNLQKTKNLILKLAGTSTIPDLNHGDFYKIKICFPAIQEQQKIADFLMQIDRKIEKLTKKKELLEKYKKGVMQKIFNQEIRFKNDNGEDYSDWEIKKLADIGENIIGLTYSPKDVDEENGIIVIRSSNIKEGNIVLEDLVKVTSKINEKLFIKMNDIVICTRNGSQRLIGKNIIIKDDNITMTFGAFMSVFRSSQNNFIFYLFQTSDYYEQIQANLGARINQITNKTLNNFKFSFPCIEEQTKIANFLTEIDKKINLTDKQLNGTKQYKKGLLQQMFV